MQFSLKRATLRDDSRKNGIKQKAGDAITAILPDWKQRNLLARAIELTDPTLTLTTAQSTELQAIRDKWAEVRVIREASDAAEIAGTSVADFNP